MSLGGEEAERFLQPKRNGRDCRVGFLPGGGFSLSEVAAESHGVIVLLIARAEDEGDTALAEEFAQIFDGLRLLIELGEVAALEFFPLFGFVVEPLAEGGAGSNFLPPMVETEGLFADAAGPQAIHENAPAVVAGGGFLCALETDVHGALISAFAGACFAGSCATRLRLAKNPGGHGALIHDDGGFDWVGEFADLFGEREEQRFVDQVAL